MFTLEQIKQLKQNNFPQIFLKNVILNQSGENIELSINFFINEDINNLKVFKNKNKEKLKIKVFTSNNNSIINDLQNISTASSLTNILRQNKILFKDLYASDDYLGKNDLLQKFSNDSLASTFKLNYKINFTANKDIKLNDLNVGFMMYYDENEYAKELNISSNSLDLSILSGELFTFILKNQNKNTSDGKLQDLLSINKLQKNPEKIINLLGSLQIGNLNKKFSNNTSVNKPLYYSSPAYFSRQDNGNLNFLFSVDYKKIIKNNSLLYKLNLTKESINILEQLALETSEISSIKILRRQYSSPIKEPGIKKQNYTKVNTLKKINIETLITSKDDSNKCTLVDKVVSTKKDELLSAIKEIIGVSNGDRTFEVTDASAYQIKNTLLEYGVSLSINDYFYSYLKNLLEVLYNNENILKKYLNDTYLIENYDPVIDRFEDSYIENKFYSISSSISNCITTFISILKIFGSFNIENITEQNDFIDELTSLLKPENTNQRIIMYFLEFYNSFQEKLKKELLINKNKNIEVDFWLKSDDGFVDTSENINYGYCYLYRKDTNPFGMLNITSTVLENKILSDIKAYLNKTPTDFENNLEYCVSPSYLMLQGKRKTLSIFTNNNNTYTDTRSSMTNEKYIDMDVSIKSYINSNKLLNFDINNSNNYVENINSRLSKALNNNNITIENFYNTYNESYATIDKSIQEIDSINRNINAEQLLLALSKIESNNKAIDTGGKIPFHILSFQKSYNNFFELLPSETGVSTLSVLNDLNKNSKFLILFNTICKIQFLNITNLINGEKKYNWYNLDRKNINELSNKKIICRLSLYQNFTENFSNFYEIEMPFYDKYFTLEVENDRVKFPEIAQKTKNYSNYDNNSPPSANKLKNLNKSNLFKSINDGISKIVGQNLDKK